MNLTADKFISAREEEKLLKAVSKHSSKGDRAAIVDMMLFQLLSLTGLRISEALNLKWADIGEDYLLVKGTTKKTIYPLDAESGVVVQVTKATTKGGRSKETVILGNKALKLLEEFKQTNPFSHSEYLFNTQKGKMGRTSAHDRLKYWLKVAGLRDSITCHSFRHTYCTTLLDAGLPLPVVRDQARHSNIAVTSVYLHFTQDSKAKLKEIM